MMRASPKNNCSHLPIEKLMKSLIFARPGARIPFMHSFQVGWFYVSVKRRETKKSLLLLAFLPGPSVHKFMYTSLCFHTVIRMIFVIVRRSPCCCYFSSSLIYNTEQSIALSPSNIIWDIHQHHCRDETNAVNIFHFTSCSDMFFAFKSPEQWCWCGKKTFLSTNWRVSS